MRLRELIVAIKIKANTKGAEKVERLLADITKHAKAADRQLDKLASATAKLDKNLKGTARSGKDAGKGLDRFARSAKAAEKAAEEAGRAADRAGDKMAKAGDKAGRSGMRRDGGGLSGVGSAVKGGLLVAGTAAVIGAGFAASIAGERESLRATLRNMEGDEQKAAETFARIEDFATKTPFQIEQIANGVIKLRGAGLDASNETLRAYGDLASTAGKTLDDVVEASKDAVVGEFERLKELNIKAKSVGDNVEFTFRGQTTSVEKNSEAIEAYLVSAGKLPGVAGAMSAQMTTLNGVFSNFKDTLFSAVDESMRTSGALDEMKGLLGDLTGTGSDAATVFGEFLGGSIKDLRTWLKTLTREQIKEWLERASRMARTLVKGLLGLSSALIKVIDGVASFVEGVEGSGPAIEAMVIALGVLAIAGTGTAGIFAAAGAAAVAFGMNVRSAGEDMAGFVSMYNEWQIAYQMMKNGGQSGAELVEAGPDSSGTAEAMEAVRKTNQSGLGEEFFLDADAQAVELGLVGSGEGGLDGAIARTKEQAGMSTEELLATRAGDAKIGVNKQAAKFLDDVQKKRNKDISNLVKNAKSKGLSESEINTLVEARNKELDSREQTARQQFTKGVRTTGDFDDAAEFGLAALDDPAKKRKGGGRRKPKAQGGKDGGKDILEALGLKGPGSILDNRPAPQSLMIQTTIVTKAAEKIEVRVTVPQGSNLAATNEVVGNEVGKAVDAAARKQLLEIVDDAWSLRWEQLAKARGGGRVPKSSKKRGGV